MAPGATADNRRNRTERQAKLHSKLRLRHVADCIPSADFADLGNRHLRLPLPLPSGHALRLTVMAGPSPLGLTPFLDCISRILSSRPQEDVGRIDTTPVGNVTRWATYITSMADLHTIRNRSEMQLPGHPMGCLRFCARRRPYDHTIAIGSDGAVPCPTVIRVTTPRHLRPEPPNERVPLIISETSNAAKMRSHSMTRLETIRLTTTVTGPGEGFLQPTTPPARELTGPAAIMSRRQPRTADPKRLAAEVADLVRLMGTPRLPTTGRIMTGATAIARGGNPRGWYMIGFATMLADLVRGLGRSARMRTHVETPFDVPRPRVLATPLGHLHAPSIVRNAKECH